MSRWSPWVVVVCVGCGVEFHSGEATPAGDGNNDDETSSTSASSTSSAMGGSASATGGAGQGATGGAGGDATGGRGGAGGRGRICEQSPCRIMPPQCGCEDGSKCVLDETWMATCTPVDAAPLPEGSLCSTEAECVAGTSCKGYWGGQTKCLAYCESDADCTQGTGSKCIWKNDQTISTLCTTACDPGSNSGCAFGEKCTLVWDSLDASHVGTTCAVEGSTQEGFGCSQHFDCAAGLICVSNGSAVCRKLCVVGGNDCPVGKQCYGFDPAVVVDGTTYGGCF